MCVLLTYSAITCSNALNSRGKPAESPMSSTLTFDIDKTTETGGEFETLPCPRSRQSNKAKTCENNNPTERESFWIEKLNTYIPMGLNVREEN